MNKEEHTYQPLRVAARKDEVQPGEGAWTTLESLLLKERKNHLRKFYALRAAAAISFLLTAWFGWNQMQSSSKESTSDKMVTLTTLDTGWAVPGPQIYRHTDLARLRNAYATLARKSF